MRSSTRATSVGSDAAWNEFGITSGLRRVNVPVASREAVSSAHSSSEPVHQWMRSGWVSSATSVTQARMPAWVVGAPCPVVVSLIVWLAVVAVIPEFLQRSSRFARPR